MKAIKEKTNFHFKVNDPIYNVPLIFIVGDKEYYKKHMKNKLDCDYEESQSMGGETILIVDEKEGSANTIVWIPRLNFSIGNYSTIAHEVLHATFQTLNMIGVKLDYNNQEPINYYFDYLFGECLDKLIKFYRKK